MANQIVGINRNGYSDITDPLKMKQYVYNRLSHCSGSVLYEAPNIPVLKYDEGTEIMDAIQTSINNHNDKPTIANASAIKLRVAAAVLYLDSLAALVIPIANDPTNSTSRTIAALNITISGFTHEKLDYGKHGTPEQATFTATYVGGGVIEINITNGTGFSAVGIIIIAVGIPPVTTPPTPLPIVIINNGQVEVSSKVAVPMVSKTMTGKGQSAKLYNMGRCAGWNIYIYSMNGNKLISVLSMPVPVIVFTPPTA